MSTRQKIKWIFVVGIFQFLFFVCISDVHATDPISRLYIIPVEEGAYSEIEHYPNAINNSPCSGETSSTSHTSDFPYYSGHDGVDYNVPSGTPVYAAASGTVGLVHSQLCSSVADNCYGYYMAIDHGDGNWTLYAHLSSYVVSDGDAVYQGQLIAYSGDSGPQAFEHLHWEVLSGVTSTPIYGRSNNPYFCDDEWFTTSPPTHSTDSLEDRENSYLLHLNPFSGQSSGVTVLNKLGTRSGL